MNEDDINDKANEPSENYEVSQPEINSDEMHPVLEQLLEKSIKEADAGLGIPHEEVMKRIKEKYLFLK